MSPLLLFWLVFKASLLSTGGLGNAPGLHADVVKSGLVDERAFANAIAVGQISPGPNGLWVVVLGYNLGGFLGAMGALFAAALPPLLVLGTSALYHRTSRHPAVEGLVWGLGLIVAGVTTAVMLGILRHAGLDPETIGIGVVALLVGLHGRVPVIVILVGAALLGLALERLT